MSTMEIHNNTTIHNPPKVPSCCPCPLPPPHCYVFCPCDFAFSRKSCEWNHEGWSSWSLTSQPLLFQRPLFFFFSLQLFSVFDCMDCVDSSVADIWAGKPVIFFFFSYLFLFIGRLITRKPVIFDHSLQKSKQQKHTCFFVSASQIRVHQQV